MSDLETTYRSALRWYPKRWRLVNEDAMIGTLLELAAGDDRTEPAKGELADLRWSAVATRTSAIVGRIPSAVRRRAGVLAFGLAVALAGAGLFANAAETVTESGALPTPVHIGPFSSLDFVFYGVWIIAAISALLGRRALATGAVIATIPLSLLTPELSIALGFDYSAHLRSMTALFLDLLALIALTGGISVRGASLRPFVITVLASLGAVLLGPWSRNATSFGGNQPRGIDGFWAPIAAYMTYGGFLIVLLVAILLWRLRQSPWSGALVLVTAAFLPVGIVEFDYDAAWFVYLSEFAGIALLVGAILGLLRIFGLRVRITRV